MKIRNKKLVNGVIAAFMVVLMTGAAFAFVSQGPLNFGGAAGVDSALALAITGSNHYGIGVDAELDLTVPVVAANGSGYRNAAMTVDFDGIGQSATYNFTVTNIGTLTAEIAPISLEFVPNSSQLLVWTQQGALETEGAILAPGEYVNFSFSVAFDAAGVNNWYYSAVSGVSFVLNYGLVGSYVPEPTTSLVTGIAFQLETVNQGNVFFRNWTDYGTRGWARLTNTSSNYTGDQNQWHRGTQDGRPQNVGSNPWVSVNGILTPGGVHNERHAYFTLNAQLEDGSNYILDMRANWVNTAGGLNHNSIFNIAPEDSRFEVLIQVNGFNIVSWQIFDKSGVN